VDKDHCPKAASGGDKKATPESGACPVVKARHAHAETLQYDRQKTAPECVALHADCREYFAEIILSQQSHTGVRRARTNCVFLTKLRRFHKALGWISRIATMAALFKEQRQVLPGRPGGWLFAGSPV
jgi:hypothetical protein